VMARTNRPLVVSGHSAGGHLTACLMARPEALRFPVRAAMPISGLFDLEPLVPTSINTALSMDEDEARKLSPIAWPTPSHGHLIAVVGEAESSEFLRQSRIIVDRWANAGTRSRYHEVPGAHHFDVLAGLAQPSDTLVDMLVDLAAKA
jgi:arylformamidase